MINPSSKASLKMQCLLISNGDVGKAQELYEFFTKDMGDMPTYDPPQPTWVDKTKSTLGELFSFIGEHKEGLSQGYEIVRGIANARGAKLPPIASIIGEGEKVLSSAPLPPINE